MEYYKNIEKKDGRVLRTGGPRDMQRSQRMDRDYVHIIEALKEQISNLQDQLNASQTTGFSPEQVDDEIRKSTSEAITETKIHYEGLIKKAREKEVATTNKLNNTVKANIKRLDKEVEKHKEVYDKKKYDLEKEYNNAISQLEDKLKLTEDRIVIKDELIETLREEKDYTIKNLIEEQTKKMEELTRSMSYNQENVEEYIDRPKMEDVFIDPLEEGAGKDLTPYIDIEDESIKEKEDIADKVDKLRGLVGDLKK